MELDKAIQERRTIRKYEKREIPVEFLNECINAARYAPNAGNIQNFRFVIVRKKDKIKKIMQICEGQPWIENAPAIIVACSETEQIKRLFGIRGEVLYTIQNCAAAIQNLLLKAYELKLGTAWIGLFDEDKLKEILNITGEVRPQAVITIGYYKEQEQKAEREPLDNFVYFEQYGKREDKTLNPWPVGTKIKEHLGKLGDRISYRT